MKKSITLTALSILICLQTLSAQSIVTKAVERSFDSEFKNAKDVRWSRLDKVYLSRFSENGEYKLAYFGAEGDLILSGKMIASDIMPTLVKKEVERIQATAGKSTGFLATREVYELIEANETKYFTNLENEGLSVSIMVSSNGHSRILKKTNKSTLDQPVNHIASVH